MPATIEEPHRTTADTRSIRDRVADTSRKIRARWSEGELSRRHRTAETMQAQLAVLLAIAPQPELATAPAR